MPLIHLQGLPWSKQPDQPTEALKALGVVDLQLPSASYMLPSGAPVIEALEYGWAYKANGSSTYFYNLSAPPELDVGKPWTIMAYVIGNASVVADARIYSFGNSAVANTILSIGSGLTTSTKMRIWVRDKDGAVNTSVDTTATVFETGVPHLAVITYDGTTIRAYVDGVADVTATATFATGSTFNRTAIGALLRSTPATYSPAHCLLGAACNRALTAEEIAEIGATPWGIFAPQPRTIFIPAAGGGGATASIAITTDDATVSGGASVSPVAALNVTTEDVAFAGSAGTSASASLAITTEDSTFSGSAQVSPITGFEITTDVVIFAGSATVSATGASLEITTDNVTFSGTALGQVISSRGGGITKKKKQPKWLKDLLKDLEEEKTQSFVKEIKKKPIEKLEKIALDLPYFDLDTTQIYLALDLITKEIKKKKKKKREEEVLLFFL